MTKRIRMLAHGMFALCAWCIILPCRDRAAHLACLSEEDGRVEEIGAECAALSHGVSGFTAMICILELAIERRRVRCNGRVHGVERHLVRRKRKLSIVASARYVMYRCTGTARSRSFMLMCMGRAAYNFALSRHFSPNKSLTFSRVHGQSVQSLRAISRTRREQFLQPPPSAVPSPVAAESGPHKPIADEGWFA